MKFVCQNCSFSFDYSGEEICFCPRCGKPLDFQAEAVSLPSEMSAVPVQKMICPVCCCEVAPEDASVQCPDCKMVYHEECWEGNGGCATYGCPSSGCLNPPPEKIEVPGSGASTPMAPAVSPVSTESFRCPNCDTELSSEATFCWSCGKDVKGRLVSSNQGGTTSADGGAGLQEIESYHWFGMVFVAFCILVSFFSCHD